MDTKRVILQISAAKGYGADEIDATTTLGELLAEIEEAIATYGEDVQIVTRDKDNRYGANFGSIPAYLGIVAADETD